MDFFQCANYYFMSGGNPPPQFLILYCQGLKLEGLLQVSLLNYTSSFRPLNIPFSQKSVLFIVHDPFHVVCPLPTLFLITLYYDSFSNRMLHIWSLNIIQWLTEELHLLWPQYPGILFIIYISHSNMKIGFAAR